MDSIQASQFDWQEQILQQVDVDDLGEEAYQELLEELSDMVLWSDTTQQSLIPSHFRHQLILSSSRTLSQRAGYSDQIAPDKAYLGDPWHQSIRYRLKAGSHWQAGIGLEKDAGEPWRSQFPAFDAWHAFLLYQKGAKSPAPSWLRQGVVGHYRLRMGCGLLINQGFSLGKQYMMQQFNQRSNAFSPYASIAETDYMQGAAFQLNFGRHLSLLPYFSVLQLDGTLSQQTVGTTADGESIVQEVLSSIKTDGMHRTPSEADRRNAAWQSIFGLRAGWRGEWYDIGLHLMTTQLQYNYIRSQLYYNMNYFRGHQLTQFSTDYRLQAFGFALRGELAFDHDGGMASVNTLMHKVARYWRASLIHRYYSPQYHQLHASSISESSAMQGEQGVTLGLNGDLSSRWSLELMADWFRFSQPQFGIRDDSSQGFEALGRATYSRHYATLMLGYRIKRKGDYLRHSFDSHLTLTPTPHLSFRTQLRGRLYSEKANQQEATPADSPSKGYLLSQSVQWSGNIHTPKYPFSLNAQAAYFQSDDFNSRLYLTEKTVLYGFGFPMLYGQGLRYSLTGNLHLGPRVILEAKWAMTNYANRATISSGLQQIAGNTQQDLWLQLRLKL